MSKSISNSLKYEIKKLDLVTKMGPIDITGMFQEINIFDSILNSCMTGNILIIDAMGIASRISFDGSEVLIFHMSKNEDSATLRKAFRIYKLTDRKNISENSEGYILHFVSEEFLLSQQIKIKQTYRTTYSDVVTKILQNHLGTTSTMIGSIENSVGIRDIVIPNKSPFDAINLCSKKAINVKQSPTFLFFENKLGYNFITTSTLSSLPAVYDLKYEPKNLSESLNSSPEIFGIRNLEVISNYDVNKNIKSGVYAGTFIGIDIRNRIISKKQVNFNEIRQINEKANKVSDIGITQNKFGKRNIDMYDSKVVVFPSQLYSKESDYVKENYPESINLDDDTYNYVLQRESSLRNILQKRIRVVLPGNFDLTSGLNVNINIPHRGIKTGSESEDLNMGGKYLIIASRQIIKYDKHETILELATDSTNENMIYQSSDSQLYALEQYE
jgi:hypothetical protein